MYQIKAVVKIYFQTLVNWIFSWAFASFLPSFLLCFFFSFSLSLFFFHSHFFPIFNLGREIFVEFCIIWVHFNDRYLLSHFSNPQTTHQFYLQLRENILTGHLYCHEEASFTLGGLALQAETGDYNDALGDEYFLAEHYIPNKVQVCQLCAFYIRLGKVWFV